MLAGLDRPARGFVEMAELDREIGGFAAPLRRERVMPLGLAELTAFLQHVGPLPVQVGSAGLQPQRLRIEFGGDRVAMLVTRRVGPCDQHPEQATAGAEHADLALGGDAGHGRLRGSTAGREGGRRLAAQTGALDEVGGDIVVDAVLQRRERAVVVLPQVGQGRLGEILVIAPDAVGHVDIVDRHRLAEAGEDRLGKLPEAARLPGADVEDTVARRSSNARVASAASLT